MVATAGVASAGHTYARLDDGQSGRFSVMRTVAGPREPVLAIESTDDAVVFLYPSTLCVAPLTLETIECLNSSVLFHFSALMVFPNSVFSQGGSTAAAFFRPEPGKLSVALANTSAPNEPLAVIAIDALAACTQFVAMVPAGGFLCYGATPPVLMWASFTFQVNASHPLSSPVDIVALMPASPVVLVLTPTGPSQVGVYSFSLLTPTVPPLYVQQLTGPFFGPASGPLANDDLFFVLSETTDAFELIDMFSLQQVGSIATRNLGGTVLAAVAAELEPEATVYIYAVISEQFDSKQVARIDTYASDQPTIQVLLCNTTVIGVSSAGAYAQCALPGSGELSLLSQTVPPTSPPPPPAPAIDILPLPPPPTLLPPPPGPSAAPVSAPPPPRHASHTPTPVTLDYNAIIIFVAVLVGICCLFAITAPIVFVCRRMRWYRKRERELHTARLIKQKQARAAKLAAAAAQRRAIRGRYDERYGQFGAVVSLESGADESFDASTRQAVASPISVPTPISAPNGNGGDESGLSQSAASSLMFTPVDTGSVVPLRGKYRWERSTPPTRPMSASGVPESAVDAPRGIAAPEGATAPESDLVTI